MKTTAAIFRPSDKRYAATHVDIAVLFPRLEHAAEDARFPPEAVSTVHPVEVVELGYGAGVR
jgi:hypothetical protein